jgi:hypothetical protein
MAIYLRPTAKGPFSSLLRIGEYKYTYSDSADDDDDDY